MTAANDALYASHGAAYAKRWERNPEELAKYDLLDGEFERWCRETPPTASAPVREKYLIYAMLEYQAACRDAESLGRDWTKVRVEVRGLTNATYTDVEVVTIENRRLSSAWLEGRQMRGDWIAKVWRPGRKAPFRIFMWP